MPNKATDSTQNWQPEDMIATVMELAVLQIQAAVANNDVAMIALTKAHQAIGQRLQAIATALTATSTQDAEPEDDPNSTIHQNLGQMIMAFQSHDALNQRLEHVCASLTAVQQLVQDKEKRYEPSSWETLMNNIEKNYAMEEERNVHKKYTGEHNSENTHLASSNDEAIELF